MSAVAEPRGEPDGGEGGTAGDEGSTPSRSAGSTPPPGAQSAGVSRPGRPAVGALRINVQLAEETGRRVGPAVWATGGIGRHDESRRVVTRAVSRRSMSLAASANNPDDRTEGRGRGNDGHGLPPVPKLLARGVPGLVRSASSRGGAPIGRSPARPQLLSRTPACNSFNLQAEAATDDTVEKGFMNSDLKRRRSPSHSNLGWGSATAFNADAKSEMSGASLDDEEMLRTFLTSQPPPPESTNPDGSSRQLNQDFTRRGEGSHRTQSQREELISSKESQHIMELVELLMAEATAVAAAAVAAAAADAVSPPRHRRPGGEGGVAEAIHMEGDEEIPEFSEGKEPERRPLDVGATAPAAAAAGAGAGASASSTNRDQLVGRAKWSFRDANANYRGSCQDYDAIDSQWKRVVWSLQGAAVAAAAPRVELDRSYHEFCCARGSFRMAEDSVRSAAHEEKVADRAIRRAAKAVKLAERDFVLAKIALYDFDRPRQRPGPDEGSSAGGGYAWTMRIEDMPKERLKRQERGELGASRPTPMDVQQEGGGEGEGTIIEPATGLDRGGRRLPPPGRTGHSAGHDEATGKPEAMQLDEDESGEEQKTQGTTEGAAQNVSAVTRKRNEHAAEENEESSIPASSALPTVVQERATLRTRLVYGLHMAQRDTAKAVADKLRAEAEADNALMLVGARTGGEWSLRAERCLAAAIAHRRARDAAAPLLTDFEDKAKLFKDLDALKKDARRKVDAAWQVRELARMAAESETATDSSAKAQPEPNTTKTKPSSGKSSPEANRTGQAKRNVLGRTTKDEGPECVPEEEHGTI